MFVCKRERDKDDDDERKILLVCAKERDKTTTMTMMTKKKNGYLCLWCIRERDEADNGDTCVSERER